MIKFIPYVFRSALRNRVRSALTVLGVAVAVFIVTGLATLLESRRTALAATPETLLTTGEKDKWWPTQSKIPGVRGLVARIEKEVPGVLGATEYLVKQNRWMSSGGGLVKIAGISKDRLREFVDLEVDDGAWREFTSRRNGALLGVDIAGDRDMKQRYVWEEGREFAMADFGGLSLYMAGTFTPRDPTLRSVILVGDEFLADADERRGEANQVLVKIRSRDEAAAVAKAIDALDFPVKLQTSTQQAALDQAATDLDEMLRYAAHVMLVVVAVIFIGLANATSMAVRERTREVGMLRSLGFSRRKVVGLVGAEAMSLSFLGGLIGCLAAFGAISLFGATVHAGSYAFPLAASPWLPAALAVASALVGLLGGLPAGIRASRKPIVEALRSVD